MNAPTLQVVSKPWYKRPLGIVAAVALVLMMAAGSGAGKWLADLASGAGGNGSLAERSQALLTDETVKEYVATDYGFKVNFPGFPAISRETIPIQGYQVPYITYERTIKSGSEAYFAVVWDYQNMPIAESDLSLEGALNGMVQNTSGAKLITSNAATLAGRPAIEGHYTAPADGVTYDAYTRLTTNGKRMDGVMTIGAAYADFDAFARSFQFTN